MDFSTVSQSPDEPTTYAAPGQAPPSLAPAMLPQQPVAPPQPKPYHEVLGEFREAQKANPALSSMGLPEYSTHMNNITGTNQYNEGLNESTLRHPGANIALALHHFGGAQPGTWPAGLPTASQVFGGPREGIDLPAATEKGTTGLAQQLGAGPGLAGAIGKGASGLVESVPAAAAGIGLGIPGLAAVSGLQTYGETGRWAPTLLSAGGAALIPKFMQKGGQTALRLMGAKAAGELSPALENLVSKASPNAASQLSNLSNLTPEGVPQVVGEFAGKQLGLTANMLGTQIAQTAVDPNLSWEDKLKQTGEMFKPTSLVSTGIGQLPFTLMDLAHIDRSPIKQVEAQAEGQFANEFTQKWMEDRVTAPTPQEVQEGIDRAKKGPTPPTTPTVPVDPQQELDLFGPAKTDVQKAAALAEERMKAKADPVGEVLKSMGQAPIHIEAKELAIPVRTADEAWPMTGPTGAMETVRSRANDMLVAQGATTNAGEGFGSGHDQTLYTVIRGVEEAGEGRWSKEEVTQIASSRMADVWQKDKADLKVGGYRPSGEQPAYPFSQGLSADRTQKKFQDANEVMAEVAKKISPTIPSDEATAQAKLTGGVIAPGTGRLNPDYDQKLDQMISLISGDKEHRLNSGIDENLMQGIWRDVQRGEAKLPKKTEDLPEGTAVSDEVTKSERATSTLPANIIDLVSNLGPKMYEKIQGLQQAIQEEVARNGFFTTNTHNDLGRSLTTPGEKAIPSDYNPRLEDLQKQLMELEGLNKAVGDQRARGGVAPIADITAETYKAALQYTKEFDINNPESVGDFVRYIRGVIRNREKDWSRVRTGEPFATDLQGNTMSFDTREAAVRMAAEFQKGADAGRGGDYEVRYTVPQTPEKDGTFRIVENRFINIFSMPERKGLGVTEEAPEGLEVGGEPETTEKREQVPLQERLNTGEATFDDLQNEYFSKRFMTLGRLSDPVEREARRGALAANATDFINVMKNADFAKVITDGTGARKISDVSELKQKFIRYLQFMRDGGYVDTVPNKTGTGIIGEGNLEAFNNYMRGVGLGFGDYPAGHRYAGQPRLTDWNRDKSGGNFFEKFQIFSKYMGRYMMDPRTLKVDGERRPDGDYGFLPSMAGQSFMDKTNVPWATAKAEGAPVARLKAANTNFPDLLYSKEGNPYTFVARYDNPLADLQIRSTEKELFTRASKIIDLYERFGNVDPDDLAMAKLLIKSPFVKNQHVGFSMAADKEVKGYFHTDHISTSDGILVDPYKPAAGGRMELQTPKESFKTFLEELGHSAVDFAYHSDLNFSVKDDYLRNQLLSFRDETNAIHKFLVQHREDTKGLLGDQFVTDNLSHALSDPREMLAQVMSNPNFRTWLSSVPDNMDHPLPAELGFGTNMFQRLWNLVKRLFDHLVGPDSANTMLNRLAQTTTRGVQLQDRMRLFNTPDIYNFLQQEHKLDTERLESLRGQPIPKPTEPTQVYQQPGGVPERPETKQQLAVELLAARIQLQNILAREHTPEEVQNAGRVISDLENQVKGTPSPRGPYQPSRPEAQPGPITVPVDPVREMLLEDVHRSERALETARLDVGSANRAGANVSEPVAQENLEYAKRRLDIHDKYKGEPIPQNIRWQVNDIDSAMADAKVMLDRSMKYGVQLPQLVQKYQALIQDLQGIRDRLAQTAEERLGEVLESRVNPQRVYDSMQGSATHSTEDMKGDIWFKPYDMAYFRRVYGPVFGDKLRLDVNGNQLGYKINSADAANLTPDDVARMPPANVKPWAPSLFESMRSLFKSQGSDDQTAQAQANLMLQYGSLLRSSDRTTWGVTTQEVLGKAAAVAWNPGKYVSLGPGIFHPGFAGPQASIRHEATHTSGFSPRVASETPDVQANVMAVNAMFSQMSPNQRTAFLQNFINISHEDFGSNATWIQPLALTKPHEFASAVMEHIGDMLGNVPDPSAYLKDQMRFVPDEVSQLLRLTTWRKLQGVDRLTWQMRQAENTRGFANQLAPVLQGVTNVFKEASRSALEIAEDISEFQRLRLVYPDSYRGLLQSLSDAQSKFFEFSPEQASKIPGEALESRMPPAVEKLVRNFFPLPTSDGRLPRELGYWDKFLTQFSQFAAKYPVARSFYDMLATSRAISQTTRIKMMTALAGAYSGGKVLDDVRTSHVGEFMKSPQLRDQFSKIALDLNLYGDTKYNEALAAANGQIQAIDPQAVSGWLTPQFTKSLMDKYGVPLDKRPAMQTILDGTRNQIKLTSANIVGSHIHAMEALIAKVVSLNGDLNPEQSRSAAQLLSQAFQLEGSDPDAAMNNMLQFHTVIKNPEVFQKVYDMAQTAWSGVQNLERFLELRMPYYMSERRPGSYGLIYKDAGGKVRSQYYATGDDRNNAIKSKGLTEPDIVRQVNPQDRDYGISQSVFNVLDETHNRVVEKLTPLFGEDQAQQLGQVLDYANELRNSLNARDVLRTTTGRDLAPGREELDMFAAHQHYLNATTAAIRNRFIKLESELLFTDPGFANQPYIKDFVKGHVQAVLQPDGQLGRTIQQVTFLHYLWGNVSSMIMQMSHQVMGLAPQLTARGSSVANSYKLLADANSAVVKARLSGKHDDATIDQMVNRAKREGVITSWIARELDHSQDLSMVNRMRVTQGMPEWKSFDLLKNGLYQGYSMIRRIYDIVPIYNSEVAFVAALKHLQSDAYTRFNGGNKLSGEALYKEAAFLKDNTMFPGGKENRPGMFQTLPRSAAQAFWSLQTYANGLTTMMGDLIRRSVNPKGAGLTPAQGTQVRKAAAQMLIAQTAIGGVMAMPFASAALFALQKLFPDHDIEGDVRKTLANLAGDDGALGQSLSSIMMNGVPNSFSYGPDVGSRFALAGVFHVSPYSGVGWEQLTGPIGGVVSNALQGAQAGLRGDPMQTVESLMPTGFDRIWKTVQQGSKYQTSGGRTLVNDLSPMEIASRLIGFRPARVARIEDLQSLTKVAESAEKSEHAGWTAKQTQMLQQGGRDAEVQQNIAQRVADKKGVVSAKQLADDISKEYAERNMPVNLRSFGNRATILAQKSLRGVLGTQTEGPGETERLQMQQQIAQRLGLGGPTPGTFRHAAAVDQLTQMYPHLTNSMANLLLTHAAGSRPPPDLYEELLSSGE